MKLIASIAVLSLIVAIASAHMHITGAGTSANPTATVGLRGTDAAGANAGDIGYSGSGPKGGNQAKCGTGAANVPRTDRLSIAPGATLHIAGTVVVTHGANRINFNGTAGANPNFSTTTGTMLFTAATDITTDGTNWSYSAAVPSTASGDYTIQVTWPSNGGYYQCVDLNVNRPSGSAASTVAPASTFVAVFVAVIAFVAALL
ncbi:uncharacterized protein AMSG_01278 [Thecamonas trahens ATCC 50062]|uniref:Uncharacterized protein n=1 Tax=Thecamonas trahens ATCC 50062 TaxID=461836 RepID=A0A0L0DQ97_THETB|nr:hypothetical protein AMSG_01278 [Thecamonas trahens ATCC 50062]KNC53568.1 hypothetical protein AMSG_01278 [Thecamonas trahens ATCC 50062]|eukprot:XP_013761885.1 hypothetical protein AMSG_01278 [Thecamonas trahens ATCC 50062]